MKYIVNVKRLDNLGRIVIPKKIRDEMGLHIQTPMEIIVETNCIILKKYEPACILCSSIKNIHLLNGKRFCEDCINKMGSIWSADFNTQEHKAI